MDPPAFTHNSRKRLHTEPQSPPHSCGGFALPVSPRCKPQPLARRPSTLYDHRYLLVKISFALTILSIFWILWIVLKLKAHPFFTLWELTYTDADERISILQIRNDWKIIVPDSRLPEAADDARLDQQRLPLQPQTQQQSQQLGPLWARGDRKSKLVPVALLPQRYSWLSANTRWRELFGASPRVLMAIQTSQGHAVSRVPVQMVTFLKGHSFVLLAREPGVSVSSHHALHISPQWIPETAPEIPEDGSGTPKQVLSDPALVAGSRDGLQSAQLRSPAVTSVHRSHSSPSPGAWTALQRLLAIGVLYDSHPHSDWYLLADDESYVFVQSLASHLASLDASKEHYLGSIPMPQTQEAQSKPVSLLEAFSPVHPLAVSRQAAKRISTELEKCLRRHERDGDPASEASQPTDALRCLHSITIPSASELPGTLRFKAAASALATDPSSAKPPTFPPVSGPWPADPCLAPTVLSGLAPQDIQWLHRFEGRIHNYGQLLECITSGEISKSKAVQDYRSDIGVARGAVVSAPSADSCRDACIQDDGCQTWAYQNANTCRLTAGIDQSVADLGTGLWGIIANRYQCPL
ncbi:uncharacterized protein BJ171DRAFT_182758 [Polychytrium aggregatum]|uniref:uncharacterized protein n=1 Tax=Polychytrium aggregatum TaxID=110093 RepID=UPI0022FE8FCD|nr:uncharacterized protein BJ171DRAFT_182758 [Polychytrium aggregatum]KAI9202303.1 hypothetical protein BJ171DRAFT_182758 [Polychytrium aggregatum]